MKGGSMLFTILMILWLCSDVLGYMGGNKRD